MKGDEVSSSHSHPTGSGPGAVGCPHFPFEAPADPLDLPEVHRALQDAGPVSKVMLPPGQPDTEAWLVTGHAEALRVYRDDDTFSRAAADGVRPFLKAAPIIIALDGEHHRRVRGLVSAGFTPRMVARSRAAIKDLAVELLDEMIGAGEPGDLAEGWATRYTLAVIARQFDLPPADYPQFRAWSEAVVSVDPEHQAQAPAAMEAMVGYAAGLLPARAENPGEDLLSLIATNAVASGVDLAEAGLLAVSLVVGGWETTAGALVSGVHRLLTTTDEDGHTLYSRLCAEPELIPTAVEEVLRSVPNSVLGATQPRRATRDVELGGVLVREHEIVIPSPDSAGRDPKAFDDPERVDLARNPNPHLAFGSGPHMCIGAHLGRVELQVAFEVLTSRLPGLRLAVPVGELDWRFDLSVIRRPARYPVAWTPPVTR
ncbi:cytochrome P450 [Actinomadura sp. SCN-SB]|uniref:cytochrome P450 n=1 Tax=Actinomadura sp. SCN-SB TaxID=3373092 RepID=UPI0037519ABF